MYGPNAPDQQARTITTMVEETGVKPSKPLAEAIDAWQAARPDVFDRVDVNAECLTVKAADVPDLIRRATEAALRVNAPRDTSVCADVQGLLARRVIGTFGDTARAVFDAYGARFDAVAADLAELAPQLPTVLTLDNAQRHGEAALTAWIPASTMSAELRHLAGQYDWLAPRLGGSLNPDQIEQVARFCEIADAAAFNAATQADRTPPFAQWVVWARTAGVSLRWGALDAGRTLSARLDAETAANQATQNRGHNARVQREADAWSVG